MPLTLRAAAAATRLTIPPMLRTLCLAVLLSALVIAQDKKPDVHLNHAFIVPDAETYETIRNSEFVKQFAVWEERTTKRKDITYTGFYLYGRHTYFEFLKPDERNPVGTSKIAFGVDRTGDLDLLQKRAEAAGIKTEIKTITRAFNGKDVDWFRSLDAREETDSPLSIWTLEYVPTFLTEWNPKAGEKGGVRREDVLKRYAEAMKQSPKNKPLLDFDFVAVKLAEEKIPEALKQCAVMGLEVTPPPEKWKPGYSAKCYSSDFAVVLSRPAKGQVSGIAAIGFTFRPAGKSGRFTFGSSELEIGGSKAIWWFQPHTHY